MKTRAIWTRNTQTPPPGTLGTAHRLEPLHPGEEGAWGFIPDGTDTGFYCEPSDFEQVDDLSLTSGERFVLRAALIAYRRGLGSDPESRQMSAEVGLLLTKLNDIAERSIAAGSGE